MWRGCEGGMVCFDRKRESLPVFLHISDVRSVQSLEICAIEQVCNPGKNVQSSMKKAPAIMRPELNRLSCFLE